MKRPHASLWQNDRNVFGRRSLEAILDYISGGRDCDLPPTTNAGFDSSDSQEM